MRPTRLMACLLMVASITACGQRETETLSGPVAIATQPGDATAAMKDNAPVIVMLGDSLTAGYQLPAGNALPAALQRRFDADGVRAKFINAGVSGDTTADGLNRYDWSVTGTRARVLVIALGANDFLNDLSPDIPKKNLAAILTRAREDDIAAVLVGVEIPGDKTDAREAGYAAIYPDLARQFGVPYLPNMLAPVSARPNLLQQDGLHPTAEGVEAMAVPIAGFLEPLVKGLP